MIQDPLREMRERLENRPAAASGSPCTGDLVAREKPILIISGSG